MARKLIDENDLLNIINNYLRSLDVCRNLAITIVRDPQRGNGANWTTNGYRRSGNDNDPSECSRVIADFMRNLQEQYDIR